MSVAQAQQLPEACVTVFGFAAHDSSKVIAVFHKHGYIMRFHGAAPPWWQHVLMALAVEPQSNWMHLQFEDARQAKHVRVTSVLCGNDRSTGAWGGRAGAGERRAAMHAGGAALHRPPLHCRRHGARTLAGQHGIADASARAPARRAVCWAARRPRNPPPAHSTRPRARSDCEHGIAPMTQRQEPTSVVGHASATPKPGASYIEMAKDMLFGW